MPAPISIIVTAVSGGSVGEQVCKALKCGAHEYKLVVTNTSLAALAGVEAQHRELVPGADSPDYISSVKAIAEKHDCDFIVPGSERELQCLSDQREQFAGLKARLLINTVEIVSDCLNKVKTCELLSEKGFAVPNTICLADGESAREIKVNLPCVIKPSVGGGGSAFTFIAQDSEELSFFVNYLRKNGYQPLIQEYVGRVIDEYTVGVLHSSEGALLGSSVMRREILSGLSKRIAVQNLTDRHELGQVLAVSSGISQGEFVRCPAIREECEEIASSLGSKGPLNIQGRWDGERFVTFEINPRFSGTSSARALAGFNEPELLIDWYQTGLLPREPIEPKLGEITRSLVEHFQGKD
jgi:carbamoyl-phosphate synthase large subunit